MEILAEYLLVMTSFMLTIGRFIWCLNSIWKFSKILNWKWVENMNMNFVSEQRPSTKKKKIIIIMTNNIIIYKKIYYAKPKANNMFPVYWNKILSSRTTTIRFYYNLPYYSIKSNTIPLCRIRVCRRVRCTYYVYCICSFLYHKASDSELNSVMF